MDYFTLKKLSLNNLVTLSKNLTLENKKAPKYGAYYESVF
jgi:hypothetical protein